MRNKGTFSLNSLVFKDNFGQKRSNHDHFCIKKRKNFDDEKTAIEILKNRRKNRNPQDAEKNRRGLRKTAGFCGFPAGLATLPISFHKLQQLHN